MNILILSSERPGGYYNDPIHRGFFEAAPHPLVFYGPNERGGPAFDPKRSLASVVTATKANLVLVNMRKRVKDWINQRQLADLRVKTAMIEVDFCFERSDQSWYRDCRFDVLFLRHRSDVAASEHPRTRWLPFSVKKSWIKVPDRSEHRAHDIGFMGTVTPPANYPARRRALEILKGRIATSKVRVVGEEYMRWWQRCRLGLTCSCIWRYDNAKHVIIPGAGALLLTDGSAGISELLPNGTYATFKADGSDLTTVVNRALSDPRLLERRRAGAAHVARCHTHEVRWSQLLKRMSEVNRG